MAIMARILSLFDYFNHYKHALRTHPGSLFIDETSARHVNFDLTQSREWSANAPPSPTHLSYYLQSLAHVQHMCSHLLISRLLLFCHSFCSLVSYDAGGYVVYALSFDFLVP
jgi:hypothetical protein